MAEPIHNWLRTIANRMIADFEAASEFQHDGSRGTAREATVVHEFLDRYVPGHVSIVHSGEIRSSHGDVSRQQDVAIVDRMTPPLYRADLYQVLPIECVYITGEVKSVLNGRRLTDAWENARSVKVMRKSAVRISRNVERGAPAWGLTAYDQQWNSFPAASFLFATDSSVKLSTLAKRLYELGALTVPEHRIDAIFVLRKGILGWADPESARLQFRPDRESKVLIAECRPEQVLLWMQHWLWDILGDVWRTPPDLSAYISDQTLSTSWTIYDPSV